MRTYIRIPAQFFRISLHTEIDKMTLALVPDQNHANLIAHLLNKHYGVRKGETIVVTPTVNRHAEDGAWTITRTRSKSPHRTGSVTDTLPHSAT